MSTALQAAPTLMNETYTLHPGDTICVDRDARLETLLGSCVAVVLTDKYRTIGAMCHIVHCKPSIGVGDKPFAFADAAIDNLYAQLRRRGYSPQHCDAFVYGGGNMFPSQYEQSHIGNDNIRRVLDRLRSDGVRVALQDVGGHVYRRIVWTVGPELPVVISVSVQEDR